MRAASKLYANITFDQLGQLLGIDAAKAERIAASMLGEKRLRGSIDQPESRIHFDHSGGGGGTGMGNTGGAGGGAAGGDELSPGNGADSAESLRAFDAQIENICRSVEGIANAIVAKHPEFVIVAPQ